ncbi:hypothetical protein A2950_00725 [Candidatus Kaiserbacteria bacterium RIFCSPLOWO2_01_FULL_55_19]|uniref:Uncharacterized protein n=1 Tax=Candidatus Kaiserbacteria bacterium RIFCSPLOWO2_01_FULL_55_19 TaxID=1798516 RepID=A0A1F6ES80_9BACT|nr:MAG: hypothetical protein A2950_00725 [Candidatus Kaiserbacteria bacterium RIFCSPLOWO2_01_FULL_55_19]
MPKKTSVVEEEFRARCEEALVILTMRWEVIQALFTRQVSVVSQDRRAKIQSLTGRFGTKDAEPFAALSVEMLQKWSAEDAEFFASEWKRGVKFATEVFGANAVGVALEAMKSNREVN